MLYDNGFTNKKEIDQFKNSIYANILQTIDALCECIKKNNLEFEDSESSV
jgi:hypothetical protein